MNNLYEFSNSPIKQWALEDRPREKLEQNGTRSLTLAELLAIVIGTGSRNESAVDLAKRILKHCQNDLNVLSKLSMQELLQFKGIGKAKATMIASVMEIARRRIPSSNLENAKITSSAMAYDSIKAQLVDLDHEEFWILLLNRANHIIRKYRICSGGITQTLVDVRLVFQKAIVHKAVSIILVHNHPSGQLKPSNSDIQLTKKISNSGKLLDIHVLDHLIISQKGYFSFADENML